MYRRINMGGNTKLIRYVKHACMHLIHSYETTLALYIEVIIKPYTTGIRFFSVRRRSLKMHGKGFALRFWLMRTTKIRQQPNAWHTFFAVHFFIVSMTKNTLSRIFHRTRQTKQTNDANASRRWSLSCAKSNARQRIFFKKTSRTATGPPPPLLPPSQPPPHLPR